MDDLEGNVPRHFICQMKFFLFSVAFCLEAQTSLHIVPLNPHGGGQMLCGPWAWPRLWVVTQLRYMSRISWGWPDQELAGFGAAIIAACHGPRGL
jgi:hypothetical protein